MERRKPLRRGKAMERGKPLERGTSQLKRTGIKPVGRRGRDHERRMRKLRPECFVRDGYRCRAGMPGCTGAATQAHHLWPSEKGGPDDLANLLSVCSACHDWIHNKEPRQAKMLGLLRDRLA